MRLTVVWSGVVALVAYKIVDMVVGLRVTEEEEREGLDITLARRDGLPQLKSFVSVGDCRGRRKAAFFVPATGAGVPRLEHECVSHECIDV